MTRIILLLLVALTGPFCTFTHASTLVVPTASDVSTPAVTDSNQPAATQNAVDPAPLSTGAPLPFSTDGPVTSTDVASVSTVVSTEAHSEAQTDTTIPTDTSASEDPITNELFTTQTTAIDKEAVISEDFNQNKTNGMLIDDEEAMGTGQLVGIVIGALIAVIVVIAVIILVVRRMGQYSP